MSILRIARQVFLRIAYCAAELLQYPAIRPRTSARHTLVLFWPGTVPAVNSSRLRTYRRSFFFLVFFFRSRPPVIPELGSDIGGRTIGCVSTEAL